MTWQAWTGVPLSMATWWSSLRSTFNQIYKSLKKKKKEESLILKRNCSIEFYKISVKSHKILCETTKVDYVLLSNRSVTCTFTINTVTSIFNKGNELKIHITLQFQIKSKFEPASHIGDEFRDSLSNNFPLSNSLLERNDSSIAWCSERIRVCEKTLKLLRFAPFPYLFTKMLQVFKERVRTTSHYI